MWRQTSPIFFNKGRFNPNLSECLSQTLTTQTVIFSSQVNPSLGEMPPVFYSLLTSILSETTLNSKAFQLQNLPSWSHVLCKGFAKQSNLKLYCAPAMVVAWKPRMGMIFAWKLFPKLYCVLNMPTMNHLSLDSITSAQG